MTGPVVALAFFVALLVLGGVLRSETKGHSAFRRPYRWISGNRIVAVAAALGLVDTFRKVRPMFWFLTIVIVFDIVYCLFYGPSEDKDAYYMPLLTTESFYC